MRSIIVKCVDRHTRDTVNGPMTKVKLVPDGPLETNEGALTLCLHDEEDLAAYQVGRRFRLTPVGLETGARPTAGSPREDDGTNPMQRIGYGRGDD